MIKTSLTTIIIALATAGLIFSSATVFKPNAQFAFGSESGSGESEKKSSSSSDKNEKQSTDESNKQSSSSSSDEDKKKQLDDDEKKIQDDEKQVQAAETQVQAAEKQVQADVVKLESDEKQIKIDLIQSETVVQGKGPQNLQNPSIQQSLEASKQQQPNPGKLATPPNVLEKYNADQQQLIIDEVNLKNAQKARELGLDKLHADENNYATHINALSFDMCRPGQAVCITGLPR